VHRDAIRPHARRLPRAVSSTPVLRIIRLEPRHEPAGYYTWPCSGSSGTSCSSISMSPLTSHPCCADGYSTTSRSARCVTDLRRWACRGGLARHDQSRDAIPAAAPRADRHCETARGPQTIDAAGHRFGDAAPNCAIVLAVTAGIGPGLRPGLGPPRTVASVMAPSLIADVFILVGVIYDWRTRGRPHPAYLIGGATIVAAQVLRGPLSTTQWWSGIVDCLARFGG
jgi:hypothetical protein